MHIDYYRLNTTIVLELCYKIYLYEIMRYFEMTRTSGLHNSCTVVVWRLLTNFTCHLKMLFENMKSQAEHNLSYNLEYGRRRHEE